jgi:NADH-quinone oxidoreductase subunit L
MLVTVGITALYSLRCVWMVFFAQAGERHVHEAGPAMKTALIPLAAASLVTWLLAGPFQRLMAQTLPLHFPVAAAEAASTTGTIAREVLVAPSTWLAVGVVVIGAALWAVRSPFERIGAHLRPARRAAEAGYGFEAVNRGVSRAVEATGEALRATQSGLLNWNVAAIVMAVIAVLAAVVLITGWGG